MFKFSKKSLEKLNNPLVSPKIRLLMNEAIKTSPIDFSIIETVRTVAQQKLNVAKGVSKTMSSRHIPINNKSGMCEAVDVAPYPINWRDIKRFKILGEHIKKVAEKNNIKVKWGGDFVSFKDYPHFELV